MLLALLALTLPSRQAPAPSLNGLWVDGDDHVFVVAFPRVVWADIGDRHYSLSGFKAQVSGLYTGEFQSSKSLTWNGLGPSKEAAGKEADAIKALYANTAGPDPDQAFSSAYRGNPVPTICYPETQSDYGDVTLSYRAGSGDSVTTMHLQLHTAAGATPFKDDIYFVGKSPLINVSGSYADMQVTMQISESGERSKRAIDGTIAVAGTTYDLHGTRLWTRAAFTLAAQNTAAPAGKGWLLWTPTTELIDKLKTGATDPTNQITVFLDIPGGPVGGLRTLRLIAQP